MGLSNVARVSVSLQEIFLAGGINWHGYMGVVRRTDVQMRTWTQHSNFGFVFSLPNMHHSTVGIPPSVRVIKYSLHMHMRIYIQNISNHPIYPQCPG